MGEGHVRFSLIEGDKRLREATERIGEFLKSEPSAHCRPRSNLR